MKTMHQTKRQGNGFSLIELLIVVAILGLLAAVAVPVYQSQTTEAQRADATSALMEAAHTIERHHTNNNSYAGATVNGTTEKGFYTLSLPVQNATAYTIRATRVKGNDPGCTTIEINQAGQKTPAECW